VRLQNNSALFLELSLVDLSQSENSSTIITTPSRWLRQAFHAIRFIHEQLS
jgi:hypothetical protein